MSQYKLSKDSIKNSVPPYDPWTTLILEQCTGMKSGKIRLDYGAGRQSSNRAHKTALSEPIMESTVDVDGEDRQLFVVSSGQDRQVLAADELSRRLYKVTYDIFNSYRTKRRGKTPSRPAKKMWFNLVISDANGAMLDEMSCEHTRDERGRVDGRPRDHFDDDDDDDDDVTTSETSPDPESKFARVLMRERAELHGMIMTCADQSKELARIGIDQARVIGEAYSEFVERTEGYMQTSLRVQAQAVQDHAAAQVAQKQLEMEKLLAENNSTGFWETPTGGIVQGQIGGLVDRLVEAVADPERLTDFAGRVAGKAMDYYERYKTARGR